jgi:hypothetical protein
MGLHVYYSTVTIFIFFKSILTPAKSPFLQLLNHFCYPATLQHLPASTYHVILARFALFRPNRPKLRCIGGATHRAYSTKARKLVVMYTHWTTLATPQDWKKHRPQAMAT